MQTLKIKYTTSNDNIQVINEYRKQYSNILHCAYNRALEKCSEKTIYDYLKNLNNIGLLDSWFIRSAVKESSQMVKMYDNRIIFGGRKNFIARCKGKITKDEFMKKRLSPLYSVGEANQYGNRKFRIVKNLSSFTFKPCKSTHIELEIVGQYKNYKQILNKLFELQENKQTSISYKLDSEYIYVSFDETQLNKQKHNFIEDRVFAIDLNPNYIGWSVVDWKSSSEFHLVDSGVISIKTLNDKYFSLKKSKNNPNGYDSSHQNKLYLNNKRNYEVFEITKNMVNKSLHYKCNIFAIEELNIKSKDQEKGKKFNQLCNNLWNRRKMVQNIEKRCNMLGIRCMKVKPNYSSFVGNFLFRGLKKPDMVLASIEIGRRAYELYNQYITKKLEQRKNIIRPEITDFYDQYTKSLEEFGVEGEFSDLVELYYYLKKKGCRYRLSLDELHSMFYRCFSKPSMVLKLV